MALATVNLRSILREATALVWTPEWEAEFQQMKIVLCNAKYIKPFDPELDIELLVDTSKVAGAGYLLIQHPKNDAESVHIVRCGSVNAKKSWASMAPVEAEATGIEWAVDHCSHYLKGSDNTFTVITDHYPLFQCLVIVCSTSPRGCGTRWTRCWRSSGWQASSRQQPTPWAGTRCGQVQQRMRRKPTTTLVKRRQSALPGSTGMAGSTRKK